MAIVISAWRRSWPWFQRRKSCCMSRPTPATIATRGQRRDDPLREAHLRAGEAEPDVAADHVALHAQRDVAAEQEEGAVGHVDDAHEPEDQREAAGHDEVQRRRGEAVEQRDEEVLRIVDRGPEARPRGDEEHPDDREDDECEQDCATNVAQRPVCSELRHAGATITAAPIHVARRTIENRYLALRRLLGRYSTAPDRASRACASSLCGRSSAMLVMAVTTERSSVLASGQLTSTRLPAGSRRYICTAPSLSTRTLGDHASRSNSPRSTRDACRRPRSRRRRGRCGGTRAPACRAGRGAAAGRRPRARRRGARSRGARHAAHAEDVDVEARRLLEVVGVDAHVGEAGRAHGSTLTHPAVALQRERGADDDAGVAAGELQRADRDARASPGS